MSSPRRLRAVSTLGSGTRVIGVYEQRWGAAAGPLCVYLHGVGDPGNVGTVLRSAQRVRRLLRRARSGLRGPALAEGGAREHGRDLQRRAGARRTTSASCPGERVALERRRAELLVAAGLPLDRRRLERRADAAGRAPSATGCRRRSWPPASAARASRSPRESLNAAMAATVALYEMTRGREPASGSSRVRAS